MPLLTKVYNKGIRPIVWHRTRTDVKAIHPGKFDVFGREHAEAIIKKFPDAVSEADYKKKPELKLHKEDSKK